MGGIKVAPIKPRSLAKEALYEQAIAKLSLVFLYPGLSHHTNRGAPFCRNEVGCTTLIESILRQRLSNLAAAVLN